MPKALIIGGSIAGLFGATAFRHAGWDVDVFERSAGNLSGRGAGIVTQPQLIAIMNRLGLDTTTDFGVGVMERLLVDTDGAILSRHDFPQIVTAWDAIYAALRKQVPDACYHAAHDLQQIKQTSEEVRARFSNGRSYTGQLLVGADGIRSRTRALLADKIKPEFAGYVGWRCLTDEAAFPKHLRDQYFDHFCFHYPQGEQVLTYPVAGLNNNLTKGQRRLNLVWYRPVKDIRHLERMQTDPSGKLHALGIPPPLIAPEILAETKNAAEQMPEFIRSAIANTDQLFFQPIYDVESEALDFGRCAIAGDAAFTARPHVGAGVTKAAADMITLADTLSATRDAETAASNYNSARLETGRAIIKETKRLGFRIGDHDSRVTMVENEQNMIDTATLKFLEQNA